MIVYETREAPICTKCDCGLPMIWRKDARKPHGGHWKCQASEIARNRRYRAENLEKMRENNDRNNARRMIVCGMYYGMSGFTKRETEEMLNGTTQ